MMNITRRAFINLSSRGMVLLVAAPLLDSCGNAAREVVKEPDNVSLSDIIGKERTEILYLASLAPSGHNTQPWQVLIEKPDEWLITLDKTRLLHAVDPNARESLLSLGAFLENLAVAAKNYGFNAEYEVTEPSSLAETEVRVTLSKTDRTPYDINKIIERRTIRGSHLNDELRAEDIDFISGKDARFVYFPSQSGMGKYITEKTIAANIQQAERKDATEELSEWMRFSNSDAEKYKDGLTPASMEINGIAGLFVRMFYDKNSVFTEDFKNKSIDKVKEQCSSFGGWLVLKSRDSGANNLIKAGRLFERMFLKAKERNIAVHSMSQALEETGFKEALAKDLGIAEDIQFLIRVSYINEYPKPVTFRRSVDMFAKAV